MEVLLLFAGLLMLLCTYATLRWITQNVLPAYNHPIQATGQDSCKVITVVTSTATYVLQQCTATAWTETSAQEANPNASTEIGDWTAQYSQLTSLWHHLYNFFIQATACYNAERCAPSSCLYYLFCLYLFSHFFFCRCCFVNK